MTSCTHPIGVLCGADRAQQWLLPWWWSRYCQHHTWPVLFCDFGMSPKMKKWCQERGRLVSVEAPGLAHQVDPEVKLRDTGVYKQTLWVSRLQWFKKPFALLHSPFRTGIWIDLDCEILRPLTPLVSSFDPSRHLALSQRTILTKQPTHFSVPHLPFKLPYNGGVMVFAHGSPLLTRWTEAVPLHSHQFTADDLLLSHLIDQEGWQIQEFPAEYNWRFHQGINFDAAVLHWMGPQGKKYIRRHGGLQPLLRGFGLEG